MRVWRISRETRASDPLGGRGGLLVSGRWHTRGRRVVYTSSSLALAALEFLVHVAADRLPTDLVRLEVDVPDDLAIERVEREALPPGWRRYPAPEELRRLGDEWLDRGKTAVLAVPSAVVPEERNYLLNPAHADASRFAVVSTGAFVYDPRLER